VQVRNLPTIRKAVTYGLRNQIAVSQFELNGRPVMVGLEKFADYCRVFRDWVRNAPADYAEGFMDTSSSAHHQWQMSQVAIGAFADALQERPPLSVDWLIKPAKAL
jgi:hypothetical protein